MKVLQEMMKAVTEAGWRKADPENIKEEDIRALFDMIDRDRSGSLSKRVLRFSPETIRFYLFFLSGGEKSSKIDQRQIRV